MKIVGNRQNKVDKTELSGKKKLSNVNGNKRKIVSNLLGFIFLVSVLIIIPCIMITFYANHLITQKIRSNNKNFLLTAAMSMDSEFQAAMVQACNLAGTNSTDYNTLLHAESMSDADAVIASWHMYHALQNSQLNSGIFNNSFLFFSNPELVLTTSGSYDAQTFFQKKMKFQEYGRDYFEQLMTINFNSVLCRPTLILTENMHGQTEVYYQSAIPLAINPLGSFKADALLVLLIDENVLNERLQYLNTGQSCFLYLMDTQTDTILNMPSDTDYTQLLGLEGLDYANDGHELFLAEEKCRITWKESAVTRLRYICVEPALLITKQLRSFLFLTILIMFIALLLFGVLYIVVNYYLKSTIFAMLNRMNQVTARQNSNGKEPVDFASLKDAVEILCSQHENNRPYLISSFLGRLIQDNLTADEINGFCCDLPSFHAEDFFRIYIFRISFPEKEKTGEAYRDILEDFQLKLEDFGYVVQIQSKQVFILFMEGAAENELTALEETLVEKWEGLTDRLPEYQCGKSIIFKGIGNTYRCYHQTLTLLDYHGVKENKNIYDINDMLNTSDGQLKQEDKNRIRQLFKYSAGECPGYVETVLASLREQNVSFIQYRTGILELLFLLQEILYEQSVPFSSVFLETENNLVIQVEQLLLPENLDKFCLEAYRRASEMGKDRNSAIDKAEQTLLNYINENLAGVNLTMLADATGMNQNYLSQYFKKHFGITFLDYVTRKKIEKAKELLENTSYTCKSIGELLGYNAPNVFIRTFKKMESVTPNEYRQRYLMEKSGDEE